MKKLLLASALSLSVCGYASLAAAQDDAEMVDAAYEAAYSACLEKAESGDDFDAVFNTCMQEKGYDQESMDMEGTPSADAESEE